MSPDTVAQPRPPTLEKAIQDAVAADNRIFELRSSRGPYRNDMPINPSTQIPASEPALRPTSSPAVPNSDPMIIDAAIPVSKHRAPLTQEERQRRRENGLCLYCGNPDHIAISCPLLARKQENGARRG